ncbi:hypothetical protein P8452_51452 [Trifolium repens]|nr:hypothetical protein P8452_51452 [Trifolium repens]
MRNFLICSIIHHIEQNLTEEPYSHIKISDFLYGGEELNEKGARREGRNTATKKKEYAARLNEEELLYVFLCFDFFFLQFLSF